jgi:hypothetical protein
LIEVEHRRIGCAYNDANRIRIISKQWVTWLRIQLQQHSQLEN